MNRLRGLCEAFALKENVDVITHAEALVKKAAAVAKEMKALSDKASRDGLSDIDTALSDGNEALTQAAKSIHTAVVHFFANR